MVVLFLGGPLDGTRTDWASPPIYYEYSVAGGMVPYSPHGEITIPGVDAVYAPIGMGGNAINDSLRHL